MRFTDKRNNESPLSSQIFYYYFFGVVKLDRSRRFERSEKGGVATIGSQRQRCDKNDEKLRSVPKISNPLDVRREEGAGRIFGERWSVWFPGLCARRWSAERRRLSIFGDFALPISGFPRIARTLPLPSHHFPIRRARVRVVTRPVCNDALLFTLTVGPQTVQSFCPSRLSTHCWPVTCKLVFAAVYAKFRII